MADDDANWLSEQLRDLTLIQKPLKSALKGSNSRIEVSSKSSPEITSLSLDTAPEAGTPSSDAVPETTTSPNHTTPLKPKKCIGWKDIHEDMYSRKKLPGYDGFLYDGKLYELTDEEREWKRSGQVKKWKINFRFRRRRLFDMLKERKKMFLRQPVKKKRTRRETIKEVESRKEREVYAGGEGQTRMKRPEDAEVGDAVGVGQVGWLFSEKC